MNASYSNLVKMVSAFGLIFHFSGCTIELLSKGDGKGNLYLVTEDDDDSGDPGDSDPKTYAEFAAANTATVALTDASLNQFCAGTVLSRRVVLTTATCIDGKSTASIRVSAGSDAIGAGSTHSVQKISAHPDYGMVGKYYKNDVALIYLDSELNFSTALLPAKLSNALMNDDDIGWSWGWNTFAGPFASLSAREHNARPNALAETLLGDTIADDQFGSDEYTGGCVTDVGAPLYHANDDEIAIVAGLLSQSGSTCTDVQVWTDVSTHATWIQTTMDSF
jgi:secreted trypsin-like serine protease